MAVQKTAEELEFIVSAALTADIDEIIKRGNILFLPLSNYVTSEFFDPSSSKKISVVVYEKIVLT